MALVPQAMTPRWPTYSRTCQQAVMRLLQQGGSLSAYRSNPTMPYGPREGSWAWKVERLAEQMFGIRRVIACNSGTMALQAMLYASGLAKGTEVVTSPYTFSATPAAILHAGMRPIFADVHPETFCLNPEMVQSNVVMPVDLFGRTASRAYSGMILADSCQAVGAHKGMAEALTAAWSFNGQKNVPAGEAGAIITDALDVAEHARHFISHGENWRRTDVGLNGRMNELTACVAYHGLKALPRANAHRQMLAMELWLQLAGETRVRVLAPTVIRHHALYVYPLLIVAREVDRARFVRRLKRLGVEAGEGYIRPHLGHYPAFKSAVTGPLPVVEELAERSLVLLYQIRQPTTRTQVRYIATAIRAALDAQPVPKSRLMRIEPTAF